MPKLSKSDKAKRAFREIGLKAGQKKLLIKPQKLIEHLKTISQEGLLDIIISIAQLLKKDKGTRLRRFDGQQNGRRHTGGPYKDHLVYLGNNPHNNNPHKGTVKVKGKTKYLNNQAGKKKQLNVFKQLARANVKKKRWSQKTATEAIKKTKKTLGVK